MCNDEATEVNAPCDRGVARYGTAALLGGSQGAAALDQSLGRPLGKHSAIETTQLSQSDIMTLHEYGWPEKFALRIKQLRPYRRPILATEFMVRGAGSTLDVNLSTARRERVGIFNWGLRRRQDPNPPAVGQLEEATRLQAMARARRSTTGSCGGAGWGVPPHLRWSGSRGRAA